MNKKVSVNVQKYYIQPARVAYLPPTHHANTHGYGHNDGGLRSV